MVQWKIRRAWPVGATPIVSWNETKSQVEIAKIILKFFLIPKW